MVSELELLFDELWLELFPDLDLEVEQTIIPQRKYRFDYVHHPSKVAIELNGGVWARMGHSTGSGITRDYEKLNLAQSLGWRVFQLSGDMINPEWLGIIAGAIQSNKCTTIETETN